jgi:excisionase family DNA binding protein
MSDKEEQLKLYSLSEAASAMGIGRDSLRELISQGKIGYIVVGKSKRISYQELIRFQLDNTIRKMMPTEINKNFKPDMIKQNKLNDCSKRRRFESKELLDEILRSKNNGNNKRKRRNMARPVV